MASRTTSSVAARVPNEYKEILDKMLETSNSTARGLVIAFANMITTGEIVVRNDMIILPEPMSEESALNLSDFLEACDSKGIRPQEAIDKATQMVWRSN